MPEKEMLRRKARVLYELAAGLEEMGQSLGEFVYDAKNDLFRFADGEFAFSREYTTSGGCGCWVSSGSSSRGLGDEPGYGPLFRP
jgi:hypothetical protein